MQAELSFTKLLSRKQLRRLHLLWHRWAGRLGLPRERDRKLRHYYIECFTCGRARETCGLTECDAALVIDRLAKLVNRQNTRLNQASGTAGRHGYPERVRVSPNGSAWRALWVCAAALGMECTQLENFIRRHYARVGLHGLRDIHSMADLNRVLWGLKAMLRHREKNPSWPARKRAA